MIAIKWSSRFIRCKISDCFQFYKTFTNFSSDFNISPAEATKYVSDFTGFAVDVAVLRLKGPRLQRLRRAGLEVDDAAVGHRHYAMRDVTERGIVGHYQKCLPPLGT